MMNKREKEILVNAYLDLIGAMEDTYGKPHDWRGHLLTIKEMSDTFGDVLNEFNASTTYFDDLLKKTEKDLKGYRVDQDDILSF